MKDHNSLEERDLGLTGLVVEDGAKVGMHAIPLVGDPWSLVGKH